LIFNEPNLFIAGFFFFWGGIFSFFFDWFAEFLFEKYEQKEEHDAQI
jgi:hypothetical protein